MACRYVKDNGDTCKANAMADSEYCYTHNPDIPESTKALARTRGGEARALAITEPLPEIPLNTPDDAVLLVADTIRRVRAGELDIRIANCIGFLTDKLLKAYEVARLNDKVEFIERVILEKRRV